MKQNQNNKNETIKQTNINLSGTHRFKFAVKAYH